MKLLAYLMLVAGSLTNKSQSLTIELKQFDHPIVEATSVT